MIATRPSRGQVGGRAGFRTCAELGLHVHDLLPGGDECPGEQVARAARDLHRPGPLSGAISAVPSSVISAWRDRGGMSDFRRHALRNVSAATALAALADAEEEAIRDLSLLTYHLRLSKLPYADRMTVRHGRAVR